MKKKLEALKALAARNVNQLAVGAGVAASAGMANAAIDLTEITTAIATAVVAIGTIGVAVLGVRAAVATYTWVRQAIK